MMRKKILMALATLFIVLGSMHTTIANAKNGWYYSDMVLVGTTVNQQNPLFLNCQYHYYLMYNGFIWGGPYEAMYLYPVNVGCPLWLPT